MIEAQDLVVEFRRGFRRKPFRALDGFSVRIEPGDIFALIGPNGAGKSTAMYCLLGLIKPKSGSVRVFGETPEPGTKMFRRISYVPEEPHYHLYLTVFEALRFYTSLYGSEIPESKINEVLDRMNLLEFKGFRLQKCSKGMKQKVGLAACLLSDAEIIFLDEPTRGLDPMIVKDFREVMLEMNRKGATIIMNSHVLSEVEMMCNRVAVMSNGKVLVQNELRSLLSGEEEHYDVSFDSCENLPAFLTHTSVSDSRMRGQIPAESLEEFFRFAREKGIRIHECSLNKSTLEDAFMNIVRGPEK